MGCWPAPKISGAGLAVHAFAGTQPDDRKIGDITQLGS